MQTPAAPTLHSPHGPVPFGRVRVGDCEVDVALREVAAPGTRRPVRLTPKAIGVLMVLVEHAGSVVTRDLLLARVWPGTTPTNDVVTQAVTQLRKALGQKRGGTTYIETIAKSGYRLLAPVSPLQSTAGWRADPEGGQSPAVAGALPSSEPAEAMVAPQVGAAGGIRPPEASSSSPLFAARTGPGRAPERVPERELPIGAAAGQPEASGRPTPPPRGLAVRFSVPAIVSAVLALVVVVAMLLAVLLRQQPNGVAPAVATSQEAPLHAPESPVRLITSLPGYELSPSLSPDASMVAYAASVPGRRGTVIMVQATEQAVPRQLTFPPEPGRDRLPAWSPDGRQIAFIRNGPGAACSVRVMAAEGGTAREVAGCDSEDLQGFSWAPDGSGLLFGSMSTAAGPAGIRILDLASGAWTSLEYSQGGVELDHAPRYSPDGRWIVFVRNPQLGALWRIPAAGGNAERLTEHVGEIRGWDWLPGGRGLVFSQRVDNQTRIYRLDLDTRVVADIGIKDAQSPAVASRAGVMAFVRRRPQFAIFRHEAGSAPDAAPEVLFGSTGRDTQPAISPDDRQIVFTSDRSGVFNLWWAMLDDPATLKMVAGITPGAGSLPQWSPDGRKLLVRGSSGPEGGAGLFEIEPSSGQVTQLPVPVPTSGVLQGVYSSNDRHLLVVMASPDGGAKVVLFDRSFLPWRPIASLEDVSLVKADLERDRLLFTRLSMDGLWQSDLQLSPGSVRRVSVETPPRWRFQTWAVGPGGELLYLAPTAVCSTSVRRIDVMAGSAGNDRIAGARCLFRDRVASTTGFSVAGDGSVVGSVTIADGTDIALIEVPPANEADPAATWVPGWAM